MFKKGKIKIVEIKIGTLKPAEYNPRQMSKAQANDLEKSIKEFGLVDPLIVNQHKGRENIVMGGHQRLKIASNLGFKTVPVVYVDFDEKELSKYLDLYPEDERDDIIPEKAPAVCKTGDIWQLGRHKVMCGDSTKREDIKKLMGGKKADMIFIDPPYAVSYGANQDTLNKKSGNKFRLVARPIVGDNLSVKECAEQIWRPSFKNLYEFSKDDCSYYMTMCQGGDQMMMMMMMSEKWQVKHELIWVKSSPVFSMGRLDYDYQHEPILFGWKLKHNWYGKGQFLKSIWEIPKPSKSELHPTMKPIELMVNALLNSSMVNDIIVDTFLGSGSTLIACEKTNRICYGMEIDPKYCDVILKRWEDFTNGTAKKIKST